MKVWEQAMDRDIGLLAVLGPLGPKRARNAETLIFPFGCFGRNARQPNLMDGEGPVWGPLRPSGPRHRQFWDLTWQMQAGRLDFSLGGPFSSSDLVPSFDREVDGRIWCTEPPCAATRPPHRLP